MKRGICHRVRYLYLNKILCWCLRFVEDRASLQTVRFYLPATKIYPGVLKAHVGRHLKLRKLFEAYPEGDHGKDATTHYRVLERFGYVTLVECVLETGRTHQIRVHMKHIGHPLFNDDFYGGDKIVKGTVFSKYKQFVDNCFQICQRQALHAKTLGFIHPSTNKEVFFDAALPEDMEQVIEKWRKYASAAGHRK